MLGKATSQVIHQSDVIGGLREHWQVGGCLLNGQDRQKVAEEQLMQGATHFWHVS
jgi:hypothetical protein